MSQTAINKAFNLAPGYDAGWSILPAAGGGYAIFGVQYPSIGARPDAFCLRVDDAGNTVFHRVFGAPNTDEAFGRGAVALADGWLVAGAKSIPTSRGWIVRLNASGQIVWENTYANTTKFSQLFALPTGGYLAVGALGGGLLLLQINTDGSVVWQQNYPIPEAIDAYLTDSGNACIVMSRDRVSKVHLGTKQMVWSRIVQFPALLPGAPEVAQLNGIEPLSKGLFAIIGSAYRELPTALYTAHYAAVWNERGEFVWDRYFRGAARADYDENEGFSVTFLSNAQNILFTGKVGDNISVTRTDLNGNVIEQKEIAAPGPVYAAKLIRDGARYAMTGAVFSNSMNTYFYRSAGNALSVQANDNQQLTPVAADNWDLQHEPAQGRAWIVAYTSENPREATFRLWALDGSLAREVRLWLTEGKNRFPLDLSGLPDGLYWLSEAGESSPPKALLIRH
ncbi:MAG: hypothetical protein RMJ33_06955 [Saprospiraceae bacterium]|nr:hypothetical protein [Saprospiraceae bacterium]MDW8229560.1 hypothetical protein [Saprospiraceae bacterium]